MARDWNAAYEEGDTPWDKGYASPPLIEFLKLQPISGRVLVPAVERGMTSVRWRRRCKGGRIRYCVERDPQAKAFPVSCDERYELGDFLIWKAVSQLI